MNCQRAMCVNLSKMQPNGTALKWFIVHIETSKEVLIFCLWASVQLCERCWSASPLHGDEFQHSRFTLVMQVNVCKLINDILNLQSCKGTMVSTFFKENLTRPDGVNIPWSNGGMFLLSLSLATQPRSARIKTRANSASSGKSRITSVSTIIQLRCRAPVCVTVDYHKTQKDIFPWVVSKRESLSVCTCKAWVTKQLEVCFYVKPPL